MDAVAVWVIYNYIVLFLLTHLQLELCSLYFLCFCHVHRDGGRITCTGDIIYFTACMFNLYGLIGVSSESIHICPVGIFCWEVVVNCKLMHACMSNFCTVCSVMPMTLCPMGHQPEYICDFLIDILKSIHGLLFDPQWSQPVRTVHLALGINSCPVNV